MTDALSCSLDAFDRDLAHKPSDGWPMVVGKGRPDAYMLDGHPIPSVTTVLDDWHPGGVDALCQWSHNLAKDGQHWRIVRDQAGDFGSSIHEYSLWLDTGQDADEIARTAHAQWGPEGEHAFREYERFVKVMKPSYSHAECTLYSKRYAYGGTFDRRERDGAVGDLKGAKKSRVGMVAQLGAYAELLREAGHGWPPRGWLLHFPREVVDANGKRRTYKLTIIDGATLLTGRDAFLRLLDAHRYAVELEAAL